jgi:hypothetical protein
MVNSSEMYIIYCIALVKMIMLRLRLDVNRLSYKPMIDLTSIEALACCAENSEDFASLSCLGCLVVGRFSEFSHLIKSQLYSPTSMQNVSITKLFELWIIYKGVFNCKFLSDWQQVCCVFNKYLRKYYRGTKKYRYCAKKSC